MEIVYDEHTIEKIIQYFLDGYKIEIVRSKYFLDPMKGVVIFKLYIKEKPTKTFFVDTSSVAGRNA